MLRQIFRPKSFAAQPWRKKVPKANLGRRRFQQQAANEANVPQFLATRRRQKTWRNLAQPLKEKRQAPARKQKTRRNLARTRPKQQPPGDGLKTAKHHLNPDANPAKNPPPQGGEVTSLKPLKEKKQAPAPGQKTQRNLVQTRPKQQPPGHGLKTAKHHLNPDANPAKNPPPQGGEVTSLKPLKEKKQAPAPGQKTQRNLAQPHPKRRNRPQHLDRKRNAT